MSHANETGTCSVFEFVIAILREANDRNVSVMKQMDSAVSVDSLTSVAAELGMKSPRLVAWAYSLLAAVSPHLAVLVAVLVLMRTVEPPPEQLVAFLQLVDQPLALELRSVHQAWRPGVVALQVEPPLDVALQVSLQLEQLWLPLLLALVPPALRLRLPEQQVAEQVFWQQERILSVRQTMGKLGLPARSASWHDQPSDLDQFEEVQQLEEQNWLLLAAEPVLPLPLRSTRVSDSYAFSAKRSIHQSLRHMKRQGSESSSLGFPLPSWEPQRLEPELLSVERSYQLQQADCLPALEPVKKVLCWQVREANQ